MYIKNNQNKNRINIPVPIGSSQKIGIFFSKQQKTKQLQIQNKQLEQKINQALNQFKEKNQLLKHLKTKNNTNQNLISILTVQNQLIMREKQINMQQKQVLLEQKNRFKSQEQAITSEVLSVQKQLFQNTKIYEQNFNLLNRYCQQIKNQKTLRYAPDSIVNVVTKLQKDCELLQRNIVIHQKKLEGKKKYLNLLIKKQDQQIKKQIQENQQKLGSPKKALNIYQKSHKENLLKSSTKSMNQLKYKLSNKPEQQRLNFKENQKLKQNRKQQLKRFNQINRKKNSIMAQISKKKI